MGSSSSSPLGTPNLVPGIGTTHAQAFNNTEYTRTIMDNILNYMIKQISIRDLLQMSKPTECKKYVLFKANSLYQYFHELRVFPTTDARGFLNFRKVEDLINPKGALEKERQTLCLIVAYFYTRIFQIYGALALTLIDDMNFMTSTGITSVSMDTNARTTTPGYYAQSPYSGQGGYDKSAQSPLDSKVQLRHFEWIRSYLTSASPSSSYGYLTRYISLGEDTKGYVYLKVEDGFKDGFTTSAKSISTYNPPPITFQHAIFTIGWSGIVSYCTLEIAVRNQPQEDNIVKIGKLIFTNADNQQIKVDHYERTLTIVQQRVLNDSSKTMYMVKDKNQLIEQHIYFNELFSEIIPFLKKAVKLKKDSDSYLLSQDPRSSTYLAKNEASVPEHLRVERLIKDLTKQRPLAHCIGRALQLLKTEPFNNEPGISQICRVKFSDAKEDTVSPRIGNPKKGKPLSDHPGLFALANLFYDTISIGSPKLTIGRVKDNGRSSFDDYKLFMTHMARDYLDDVKDDSKLEEAGIASITNKRDAQTCKADEDIYLTSSGTQKVHHVVKTMFQAQINHAAKCYQIINRLFTIQYDPATRKPLMFKLNNNLITKGFPELEIINRDARNLLVNYYTDCENKYITGMTYVLEDRKGVTDAKAKAKADTDAKAKADADAKAKADAVPAQVKQVAQAQAQAQAQVKQVKQVKPALANTQATLAAAQATLAAAKAKREQKNAALRNS